MKEFSQHPDRDLLSVIRSSDGDAETAFRELYGRHARRLYLYCLRVVGTEATARDIVQDTFMKFLLKVREGLDVDSVPAFHMTIARNLCLNHKRDSRTVYMEPELVPDQAVEHSTDRDELKAHLAKAMESLPPQYRDALAMQVYGGLSYAAICEVTGESLPVIRHRISRAKQRLRAALLPLFAQS